MTVSPFDLTRQTQALEEELLDAAARVIRGGHDILGPEVEAFER